MITTYERGKAEGKLEGKLEGILATLRETLLTQLKKKFGILSLEGQQRVAGLKEDELRQTLEAIIDASSLKELHLED